MYATWILIMYLVYAYMPLGLIINYLASICDLSMQSHLVKSSRVQPFEPPGFLGGP